MKVIIAGCGRVGAQLATVLSREGHDVGIIDKNPLAFRRLGDDYQGKTFAGIVFDRDLLEEAGVRQAQAFVAVTSGDNSNIVAARVAREEYGIETVVSRIYDPERAVIYERLGVTTIASARWTAEAVLRTLLPEGERFEGSLGPGEGDVVLLTLTVPPLSHHVEAATVGHPGQVVLAAVSRGGATSVPVRGALLQGGDQLHLAVDRRHVDRVRRLVAALGQERT